MANEPNLVDPIFRAYPTAKWEVAGKTYTFPVVHIHDGGGNRLAKHKRLYRDGARLDDTGANEKVWRIDAEFFNDPDQESGIDGAAQYPDNCNAMIDSFDRHETGTLTLPTRGPKRCRAETYERDEDSGGRDEAKVTFVWVEDNEDDAAVAAFQAPSAKTIVRPAVEDAIAACEAAGIASADLESLNDFAADLVALAEFPGDYIADLDAKAKAVVSKCEAIEKAFSKAGTDASNEAAVLLTDPANSLAVRRLRETSDAAARMTLDAVGSGQRVIGRTFQGTMSIFDVAVEVEQPAQSLITLNSQMPDLLEIPAGTVVLVYDQS